jgi:type VI secretion system protein ImpD
MPPIVDIAKQAPGADAPPGKDVPSAPAGGGREWRGERLPIFRELSRREAETGDGSGWPGVEELARAILEALPGTDVRRLFDLAGELQVALDRVVGEQLALVLDHPRFRRLEATWRGISHITDVHVEFPSATCEVQIADYGAEDLITDLGVNSVGANQSWLYGQLYEQALDVAGGRPVGLLVTGMEFGGPFGEADDGDLGGIDLLRQVARVAERALCPFVATASPRLFGRDDYAYLPDHPDLDPAPATRNNLLNELRAERESRFVALVAPRVVLREPLSRLDGCGDWFGWPSPARPDVTACCHRPLLGSGAYAIAGVVVRSMAAGWPSDIQGVRSAVAGDDGTTFGAPASFGGDDPTAVNPTAPTADGRARLMVNGGGVVLLPGESFRSDPLGVVVRAPLEVTLTGFQERRLGQLGLMTVSRVAHSARAAFYSLRMLRKPTERDRGQDEGSEELHSLLPYLLTATRFAQWAKRWGRVRHGGTRSAPQVEAELRDVLGRFCGPGAQLREARVSVVEDAAGNFDCKLSISPRLNAEDVEVVGIIPLEVRVVNAPMSGAPVEVATEA